MGSSPAKRATLPIPPFGTSEPSRGRLAQLVRASVLHTEGQRFESSIAHTFALPAASATSAASAPAIGLCYSVAVPMIGVESGA